MQDKTNLIWIDLEMTGLDVNNDHIVEIAAIVTNKDLQIIAEGPNLVIHQSDEILGSMNDWCKKYHAASGLIKDAQSSTITLATAEQEMYDFLKQYCAPGQGILCGNSIWNDKAFLQKHMPHLNTLFHYKMVDVSSVKELVARWYPKSPYVDFKKTDKHRAKIDIVESIQELKNYRTHFFIPESIIA